MQKIKVFCKASLVVSAVIFPTTVFSAALRPTIIKPVVPTTTASAIQPQIQIKLPTTTIVDTATNNTEAKPGLIGGMNYLDPQPEPPAPESKKILIPVEKIGINPQPEPPLPVLGNIDKLDPQPEPPMKQLIKPLINEVKEFKIGQVVDVKAEIQKIMLLELPDLPGKEIEILPNDNSLIARFEHNKNKINIPVKVGFNVEGGKMILKDGNATHTLKMQIPAFFTSLNVAIEKIGLTSSSLKNIELTVQNNKPVYNTIIEQKGKLLGVIPFRIKNNVQISEDGSEVKIVSPWYTKLISGLVDLDKIKFAPNIEVSKIEVIPANFKSGDTVKVKATLENTGNAYALSLPPISPGGSGSTLVFYVDHQYLGGYSVPIALEPGESVQFDYNWKNAACGVEIRAEFTTGELEETNTQDNILASTANCGN